MTDLFEGLGLNADELRAMEELAGQLALDAPPAEPPVALRQRLLGNLPPKAYIVARGSDSGWLPFAAPGIEMKPLIEDPVAGTRSFLLRLQPGAILPAHKHAGAEHCYVIEGEVHDDDHSLSVGDYEIRMPGSEHAPVSTHSGAVVMIIAGRHDEHH